MLYKINKTTEITKDTTTSSIESMKITEVVKQGSIFGPNIYCAAAAKVNDIGEKVFYRYGKIEISIAVCMDHISVTGGAEDVRKGIKKQARMEVKNKIKYILSKTKYMVVKTGKERKTIFHDN